MTVALDLREKAVSVVLAISKPHVTGVLKLLSPGEVSLLLEKSKSMSRLDPVQVSAILREFESELERDPIILDPFGQLSKTVDGVVVDPAGTESDALSSSEKAAATSAWEALALAETDRIVRFLETESPQVAAIVLSRLSPSKASEVLSQASKAKGLELLTLMTLPANPSPEAEQLIEELIAANFSAENSEIGKDSLLKAASVLNELNKEEAEEFLSSMTSSGPEGLAEKLRSMIFRFEDLAQLPQATRSAILDSIQPDRLTLALRDTSAELAESLLSSIGQRTRRMIENDLKTPGSARAVDIVVARREIITMAKRLESQGKISIAVPQLAAA